MAQLEQVLYVDPQWLCYIWDILHLVLYLSQKEIVLDGDNIVSYFPEENFPFGHDVQTPDDAKYFRIRWSCHATYFILQLRQKVSISEFRGILTWARGSSIVEILHQITTWKFHTLDASSWSGCKKAMYFWDVPLLVWKNKLLECGVTNFSEWDIIHADWRGTIYHFIFINEIRLPFPIFQAF